MYETSRETNTKKPRQIEAFAPHIFYRKAFKANHSGLDGGRHGHIGTNAGCDICNTVGMRDSPNNGTSCRLRASSSRTFANAAIVATDDVGRFTIEAHLYDTLTGTAGGCDPRV